MHSNFAFYAENSIGLSLWSSNISNLYHNPFFILYQVWSLPSTYNFNHNSANCFIDRNTYVSLRLVRRVQVQGGDFWVTTAFCLLLCIILMFVTLTLLWYRDYYCVGYWLTRQTFLSYVTNYYVVILYLCIHSWLYVGAYFKVCVYTISLYQHGWLTFTYIWRWFTNIESPQRFCHKILSLHRE